jgi:hypothetical protein
MNCLNNVFYIGKTDFRKTARCLAPNITLIVVAAILMSTMVLKCMFLVLYISFLFHASLLFFPILSG